MGITISVNGLMYTNFTNVRVNKSFNTFTGQFTFTATIKEPSEFPIKKGLACVVYINDIKVLSGYIESIEGFLSGSDHTITVSGREKTADILDSDIVNPTSFNSSISLKSLIEQTLKINNITGIEVVDDIGNIPVFTKKENINAEIGENIFDFLSKYAKKKQVFLLTNEDGNILLSRASNIAIDRYLLNANESKDNNITEINFNNNDSNRFNKIILKGQDNPLSNPSKSKLNTDIVGTAYDTEIRNNRTKVIMTDATLTKSNANEIAKWYVKVLKSRSLNLQVSVPLFHYDKEDTSKIWQHNRLVNIKDDSWGFDAQMFIQEIEYSFDISRGSLTILNLTYRDAYLIDLDNLEVYAKSTKEGKALNAVS